MLNGKGGVCTVVGRLPDDPCTLAPTAAVPVGPTRLVELLSGNGAIGAEYSLVKVGESRKLEDVPSRPETVLAEGKLDADVLRIVCEGNGSELLLVPEGVATSGAEPYP